MFKVEKGSIFSEHKEESLAAAKAWADENAEYTTRDIVITDSHGAIITKRVWHNDSAPYEPKPGEIKIFNGHYACWTV